jgi:hypothetical protein
VPKGWKYFVLSFAMTLFFCASLAMLVCIDQTCGGFDGAQTGTLLAFSPGENQVKVTLLSQEHTVSLTGLEPLRALWWKLYPLMPYPIKLGETLRESLFARLEEPPEAEQAPEEPPQEETVTEEPQEPESPPATSWDTMPQPKEDKPEPEVEPPERKTDYAPLFSPEELTLLEEQREEAQKAPEEPPQEDEGAGEEIEEPESGEIGE